MEDLGFRPNLDGYLDAPLDLMRHVSRRTTDLLDRMRSRLDQVPSGAELSVLQEKIRADVLEGIGGLPDADPDPPKVSWRQGHDLSDCRVTPLLLTSLPGVEVPALIYRPLPALEEPGPAVLFLSGHAAEGKADPITQAVCRRLAAAGLVVLVFDPWGQGERLGYLTREGTPQVPGGTAEHTYAGLQSWWLGQSSVRWFLHDARRALDALEVLPGVDPARLGITGSSGGGMLCTLLGALDRRIAAVAPGTYVSSRKAILETGKHQDAEQILLGGTLNGIDHAELLAAIAPRPVAVLAADYDFFPVEGTLETVERARRAYRLLGAEERLRLVRAPVTHRYAAELAEAAEQFFVEAFGARGRGEGRRENVTLAAEILRCTRTGQIGLDDRSARFLHDLHAEELARVSAPDRETAVQWVRQQVRSGRQLPEHPRPRWLPGEDGTLRGFWRSESDLWGAGIQYGPRDVDDVRMLRIVLPEQGTRGLTSTHRLLGRAAETEMVLALDVRGHGALTPYDRDGRPPEHQSSSTYKLLCDLLWLGDSLAAGRAFDITRAIDLLAPTDAPVEVRAEGIGALPALLAAVADERITAVSLWEDDLDRLHRSLRERLHDDGRGAWQSVVPGLARHAPLEVLREHLGERLEVMPHR